MPIHLIWGDDYEASHREIEEIIQKVIDPVWKSFNYSQVDGNDPKQSFKALEEVQSAPFGNGHRIVLVRRSPFCNGCSLELANKMEQSIKLIPENTHLILNNSNKPDKRLKTTKLIEKNIQSNSLSSEKNFILPLPWDIQGQQKLVKSIAQRLNIKMNHETINFIVESIGSDSSLISKELEKLVLLSEANNKKPSQKPSQKNLTKKTLTKKVTHVQ